MKNLCAVMIVLMTGFASRAAAQDTTGTIGGRIVDAQGLALPGRHRHGNRTARHENRRHRSRRTVHHSVSDARLVCRCTPNCRDSSRPIGAMPVRLGQAVEVPMTMQVGGVTETIQVVSSAPTDRHHQHDDRRDARQRHALATAGRPPFQRHALSCAGRQHRRQRRRRQPISRRARAVSRISTSSTA